jgi:hypothetical protein
MGLRREDLYDLIAFLKSGREKGLIEDRLFNILEEDLEERETLLACPMVIAPDHCHKIATSGRAYEIAIPNLAIEAPLLNEWHNTTFVGDPGICFELGVCLALILALNSQRRSRRVLPGGFCLSNQL